MMRRRLTLARRGQVFAMDGLLAIIIILLLVSLIRSARTRLATERSEWAARFQLEKSANDLLDALVREPGQLLSGAVWECVPPTCAVSTIRRPGLAYIDPARNLVRPSVLDQRKVNAFFNDYVTDSEELIKDFAPYVHIRIAPNRGAGGLTIEIGDTNRTTNPRLEKVSITRVVVVLEPGSGSRRTEFLTLTLAQ